MYNGLVVLWLEVENFCTSRALHVCSNKCVVWARLARRLYTRTAVQEDMLNFHSHEYLLLAANNQYSSHPPKPCRICHQCIHSRHSATIFVWFTPPTACVHYLYLVSVPPRWLVEPKDTNVERNHHVSLHCQAQGVPTPTVIWKKATGYYYLQF